MYDQNGRLLLDALPARHALFECGPSCFCSLHTCPTRLVQAGVRQKLAVQPTLCRGYGLFAREALSRGTFVCCYVGEIIGTAEARSRWTRRQKAGQGNYILVLRETSDKGETLKTAIDPTERGNVARFISMRRRLLRVKPN